MAEKRKVDTDFYLTERELQVIKAIFSNHIASKEIAEHLTISDATVRCHIASILAKTGARCLTEVVLMATGFVDCQVRNLPKY